MGRFFSFFNNIYNNISLVPTVIYNMIWIYLFYYLIKTIPDTVTDECQAVYSWNYMGLYVCIFSLVKGIFLVTGITKELDNSNHQFYLLILKIFSGVVISSIIGYKFYGVSKLKLEDISCKNHQSYHFFFSMFELTYAIFFYTFCCCIFLKTVRDKDDCHIEELEKEY